LAERKEVKTPGKSRELSQAARETRNELLFFQSWQSKSLVTSSDSCENPPRWKRAWTREFRYIKEFGSRPYNSTSVFKMRLQLPINQNCARRPARWTVHLQIITQFGQGCVSDRDLIRAY